MKLIKHLFGFVLGATLIFVLIAAASPSGSQPDLNFRVMNLERRCDILQQRVDFVERAVQNQAYNDRSRSSGSEAVVLELQRQHLSLAEQVITMQKQMLELQKRIDRHREEQPEKTEKPKEEAKPKPARNKP